MDDLELKLECACREPGHFLCFYHTPEWHETEVAFRVYRGGFWKRLIAAVRLLFDGYESAYSNWISIDEQNLKQIQDFCEAALLRQEQYDGEMAEQ